MPAGKRFSLLPDSPLIRNASRHSVTDAGIGPLIERFGRLVQGAEKDPRQTRLRYLGPQQRPEFAASTEAVEQIIASNEESYLPRGGRRFWFFEPTTKLPMLILTYDETGHEVEFYCYDHFQYPVKLDDDDFDPEKLWPNRR